MTRPASEPEIRGIVHSLPQMSVLAPWPRIRQADLISPCSQGMRFGFRGSPSPRPPPRRNNDASLQFVCAQPLEHDHVRRPRHEAHLRRCQGHLVSASARTSVSGLELDERSEPAERGRLGRDRGTAQALLAPYAVNLVGCSGLGCAPHGARSRRPSWPRRSAPAFLRLLSMPAIAFHPDTSIPSDATATPTWALERLRIARLTRRTMSLAPPAPRARSLS